MIPAVVCNARLSWSQSLFYCLYRNSIYWYCMWRLHGRHLL